MPIKSFRGKMEDNTIDTISLHTNNGSTGYKIKKLQVMPVSDDSIEAALKVYSTPQTATSKDIDFSDNTLLGAAYFTMNDNSGPYPEDQIVTFDNMIFNQDIYITLKCHNDIAALNYYIELEIVKLSLDENTVATLKDIRNIEQPSV